MATPSLNFRNRAEAGQTRFAHTVSRLFSARLQKFKAPSRAGAKQTVEHGASHQERAWRMPARTVGLAFCPLTLSLDGALNFCCREEKERRLSERSEFASSPSLRQKFKEAFAISARLSFAYFSLARQRKVGRPRQGAKGRQTTKAQPQRIRAAPSYPGAPAQQR
jgi:hypothetical protein